MSSILQLSYKIFKKNKEQYIKFKVGYKNEWWENKLIKF